MDSSTRALQLALAPQVASTRRTGATSNAQLADALISTFRASTYKAPILPRAAAEILELTRRPNIAIKAVAGVLEKDPLLAGAVLRKAQTAYYSRSASVQSLEQAIVRLGISTIRDLLLEVALSMRVFRAPGFDTPMDRLRRHSTATAYIAKIVCQHAGISDEGAFLSGLLHDAGMAASMIAIAEATPRSALDFALVWPAIRDTHERATEILCGYWKLPVELQMILAHHHNPRAGGHVHPMTAAVQVAEMVANQLGFGLGSDEPTDDGSAARTLSLSATTLELVRHEATNTLHRIT